MIDAPNIAAANWRDATRYSKGQRGKAPQTAWEITIDNVYIWVSCGHIYRPGRWVMNCAAVGLREHDLGSADATSEQARDRAIQAVWQEARKIQGRMAALANAAFAIPQLAEQEGLRRDPQAAEMGGKHTGD